MDDGSISAVPRYLILFFLLLLGGAYFAAAETAFASVSRIRMISDAEDGDKRAKKVLYIQDHFDKALTTLLIGNNIMHIGCSTAATLLASKLWGNKAVTAATFVTTFIVFILAEMIPKSYARACDEKLAPRLAGSLVFLMKLLTPLSFCFSGISRLLSSILGSSETEEPTVTEEEIIDVIENIDSSDEIDEETTELVQSALELTVTTAGDIAVPWNKVVTLNDSMNDAAVMAVIGGCHYSRLPVLDGTGAVKGILQTRSYFRARLSGKKIIKLGSLLDRVIYVRASMPADELLDYLSGRRAHMAVVRREDGSILGIVTIEDILEELVGEIYDEEDAGGEP